MKDKSLILVILGIVFIFSCKKKDEIEPSLLGEWSDQTVNYHFNTNNTYGQKFLLNGSGKDTILTDSIFGDYVINQTKKTITFNQKGYYDKKNVLFSEVKNGTTWQYKVDGNTLNYTSNTSIGQLTKIN